MKIKIAFTFGVEIQGAPQPVWTRREDTNLLSLPISRSSGPFHSQESDRNLALVRS
jgi:hypothetical protein